MTQELWFQGRADSKVLQLLAPRLLVAVKVIARSWARRPDWKAAQLLLQAARGAPCPRDQGRGSEDTFDAQTVGVGGFNKSREALPRQLPTAPYLGTGEL